MAEPAEPDEPTPGGARRRFTPTAVAMASQCRLRALFTVLREPKLPPTPFNKNILDDGKAYEARLMEPEGRPIWIRALATAAGFPLPEDVEVVTMAEQRPSVSESFESFAGRVRSAFLAVKVLPGKPLVLAQVPLAALLPRGFLLSGIPDLLIWTGESWFIADIKCSEEAKRPHGLQILCYRHLLKTMMPQALVESRGAIIHCAPGFRYSHSGSDKDRTQCLRHTRVTVFELEALARLHRELLILLESAEDPGVLERAIEEAVFSRACTECEFRLSCYSRFLTEPHASLVPLMTAEHESLRTLGLKTLEDLERACTTPSDPAHCALLELKEGARMHLDFLRQQVAAARRGGGFCQWRVAPDLLASPCFFAASAGQAGEFSALVDSKTSCLIAYTAAELRHAWARLNAKDAKDGTPSRYLTTLVLSEELPLLLHFPVPSFTLRPLRDFLKRIAPGGTPELARVQAFYSDAPRPESSKEDKEAFAADSLSSAERLAALREVWGIVNALAQHQKLQLPVSPSRP
jgi:hypothetical protein